MEKADNRVDWFKYDEDFDKMEGYKDFKMLSLYDHFLTNEEAENMITYVHIEENIISLEMYEDAEQKYLNLFETLYNQYEAKILDTNTMNLHDFGKEKFLKIIQNSCRESSFCTVVLPQNKIVFLATYDLMFVVIFYSDYPEWLNREVKDKGLFLL